MNYSRYGIDDNPYEAKRLANGKPLPFEPIFPLDEADVTKRLISAIKAGELATYVVTGTSGSGRTAVAEHIMSRYAELREGSGATVQVAHFREESDGNVDPPQVARDFLGNLSEEVKRLGAAFRGDPYKDLQSALAALRADYSIRTLQPLARDFTDAVHNLKASIACCLENVPKHEVFRGLRTMFAKSQGLLVLTLVSEKRNEIIGTLSGADVGPEIQLDSLTDVDACHLAEQRWITWEAPPPMPFDSDGLRKAFHDKPRTVGKSLKTLAFMIDSKLSNYPGKTVHPEDAGLRFDEAQIRANFDNFDKRQK